MKHLSRRLIALIGEQQYFGRHGRDAKQRAVDVLSRDRNGGVDDVVEKESPDGVGSKAFNSRDRWLENDRIAIVVFVIGRWEHDQFRTLIFGLEQSEFRHQSPCGFVVVSRDDFSEIKDAFVLVETFG